MSNEEIMKKMLEIIFACETITDDQLRSKITELVPIKEQQRVELIFELKNQGYLQVAKNQRGEVVYSYQRPEDGKKLEKLDQNDRIVFQLIQDSKGRGVSKVELKNKSGINQKVLGTCLKSLDKYGLVKSIKAKDKNWWMFFTYDQDPDTDIVGGRFYQGGELNTEKIGVLKQKILSIVESKGSVSHSEMIKYLVDTTEEARDLREEDINTLLNTLIFDDEIEDCAMVGLAEYTRSKTDRQAPGLLGLKSTPCLSCPVFFECRPGGYISPENCLYFEAW